MKFDSRKLALLLPVLLLACTPGMDNYNHGVELQRDGKNDEAEIEYKSALKANPDLAEAYVNLAAIYLNKEWYEGSIDCSKKAIGILERTKATLVEGQTFEEVLSANYTNLGVAQMQQVTEAEDKLETKALLGKWDEALATLKKATEIDPQNAEAHTNLKKFSDAKLAYVEEKRQERINAGLNVLEAFGF